MGGCEATSVLLSQGSLERLSAILARAGLSCRMVRGFLAIDFSDRSDVRFLRAHGSAAGGEEDVEAAAAETLAGFARIDGVRSRVLQAIRHHAADNGIALRWSASGLWEMQLGIGNTSLDVGPPLTRLAQEHDAAEALVRLCERNWMPKVDLEKARALLSREAPPENETPWKDDFEVEPLLGPKALAFDCSAAGREDFSPRTAEELVQGILPHRDSPAQQVLEAFVAQVGAKRFSIDIKTGAGDLEFSDGMDCYRVHPRGKRLARLVERLGVDGAIAHLVSEFQRLDRLRQESQQLSDEVMARLGCGLDFDRASRIRHYGRGRREFAFPVGRKLTLAVMRKSPGEVVRDWIDGLDSGRPTPSLSELTEMLAGPATPIATRSLLRSPHGAEGLLPRLEHVDLESVDRLAAHVIEAARRAVVYSSTGAELYGRPAFDIWAQPLWYRRGVDSWVEEEWWLEIAEQAWKWRKDQRAALVLLVNGETEPRTRLLEMMRECEEWDGESFDAGVLWCLEEKLPWPIDTSEYPRFPRVLGSPPPPLARRYALQCREMLAVARRISGIEGEQCEESALHFAKRLDVRSAEEWLGGDEILQLREACRRWAARDDDFLALAQDYPLFVAAHFGWDDVGNLLEANPSYVPAQFDWIANWRLGNLALLLSFADNVALGARFAAAALQLDARRLVREGAIKSMGTRDSDAAAEAYVQEGLSHYWNLHHLAAAIAWRRCRAVGGDQSPAKEA